MKIKLISLLGIASLLFIYFNLEAGSSVGKLYRGSIIDQSSEVNSNDTSRYLLGKLLWEGDVENGILGLPWPDPSFKLRNIWQSPSENSGAKKFSDIVSESPAFGKTGKKSIKMQLDFTSSSGETGIRHFDDDRINNNPDHILTSWYYIPQAITNVGWGVMVMQWKQLTDQSMGSYFQSHANTAVYINSRNGKNYLIATAREQFWRKDGENHVGSHPTKNIPIGQWFGIKARYIKSSPGIPNGRFTVWQIDLDGTHHLIADHQNVVTYWDKDQNNRNALGKPLRAGIAWYAAPTIPRIITAYADDPTIHLPRDPSEKVEPSYTLNLLASPSSHGAISDIESVSKQKEGTEVKLAAIPNEGYTFLNWTIDGHIVGSESELVYIMPNRNVTVVANFKPMKYQLEIKLSSPVGGRVVVNGKN